MWGHWVRRQPCPCLLWPWSERPDMLRRSNWRLLTVWLVQRQLHLSGSQCWYRGYARLAGQVGLGVANRGFTKRHVAQQMEDRWQRDITEASRLKFYCTLKQEYKHEPYLAYPVRKVRVAYARYRIGAHNLRVERERWKSGALRLPYEKRCCERCDNGQVDDEWHIFTCKSFEILRNRYKISTLNPVEISSLVVAAQPGTMWFVYHAMQLVDEHCKRLPEAAP